MLFLYGVLLVPVITIGGVAFIYAIMYCILRLACPGLSKLDSLDHKRRDYDEECARDQYGNDYSYDNFGEKMVNIINFDINIEQNNSLEPYIDDDCRHKDLEESKADNIIEETPNVLISCNENGNNGKSSENRYHQEGIQREDHEGITSLNIDTIQNSSFLSQTVHSSSTDHTSNWTDNIIGHHTDDTHTHDTSWSGNYVSGEVVDGISVSWVGYDA